MDHSDFTNELPDRGTPRARYQDGTNVRPSVPPIARPAGDGEFHGPAHDRRLITFLQGSVGNQAVAAHLARQGTVRPARSELSVQRQRGLADPSLAPVIGRQSLENRAGKILSTAIGEVAELISTLLRRGSLIPWKTCTLTEEDHNTGGFRAASWTMSVGLGNLANRPAAKIPAETYMKIVRVLYHEARHCEQYNHVARYRLAHGVPPDTVATKYGMPIDVVQDIHHLTMAKPYQTAQDDVYLAYEITVLGPALRVIDNLESSYLPDAKAWVDENLGKYVPNETDRPRALRNVLVAKQQLEDALAELPHNEARWKNPRFKDMGVSLQELRRNLREFEQRLNRRTQVRQLSKSIEFAATYAHEIYLDRPSERDARGVEHLLWRGLVPALGQHDL